MSVMFPKPEKKGKAKAGNPKYLTSVRGEHCIICESFGEYQNTPTEAHHPIHDRYSQAKRPDETAIPLCVSHHRGANDGKVAIHERPKLWRDTYGADHEYINIIQDRILK